MCLEEAEQKEMFDDDNMLTRNQTQKWQKKPKTRYSLSKG